MNLTTKMLKAMIKEELSKISEDKEVVEIDTMYFNYTPQTGDTIEQLSYEIKPRQGSAIYGTIGGAQELTRLVKNYMRRGDDSGSASYEIMKDFSHAWSKYMRLQKGVNINPKAFMRALKEKDYSIETTK